MTAAGLALVLAGAALLIVAAVGVVTLPDALSRQHAATKAGTLALALVCTGAILLGPSAGWTWRLLATLAFLLVTLPVSSHLLARAAIREAGREHEVEAARPIGPGQPGDGEGGGEGGGGKGPGTGASRSPQVPGDGRR